MVFFELTPCVMSEYMWTLPLLYITHTRTKHSRCSSPVKSLQNTENGDETKKFTIELQPWTWSDSEYDTQKLSIFYGAQITITTLGSCITNHDKFELTQAEITKQDTRSHSLSEKKRKRLSEHEYKLISKLDTLYQTSSCLVYLSKLCDWSLLVFQMICFKNWIFHLCSFLCACHTQYQLTTLFSRPVFVHFQKETEHIQSNIPRCLLTSILSSQVIQTIQPTNQNWTSNTRPGSYHTSRHLLAW